MRQGRLPQLTCKASGSNVQWQGGARGWVWPAAVGREWRWKMDPAADIVDAALEHHYRMINEFKGAPGVLAARLAEGMQVLPAPPPLRVSRVSPHAFVSSLSQAHPMSCPLNAVPQTLWSSA